MISELIEIDHDLQELIEKVGARFKYSLIPGEDKREDGQDSCERVINFALRAAQKRLRDFTSYAISVEREQSLGLTAVSGAKEIQEMYRA